MAPLIAAAPLIAGLAGAGASIYGATRKGPGPPTQVMQTATPITGQETQGAKDEVLRRLAKLRAANVTREGALSTPNVKRKVLGAGV